MNYADLGFVKVAAASTPVAIGDPASNAAAILSQARELADARVSIGVFPELCVSGYTAEDLFFSEQLWRQTRTALELLCQQNPLPLLVVGAPWRLRDGRLLNCGVAISQGAVRGMVPKSVQPNYGEFYDLRWFAPGAGINETVQDPVLGEFAVRVDQLFELGGHLIGVEVCEDLWAPVSPSTAACLAGAEILLNLSASNELIAKAKYRRDLVRMASAKNICAYIYAGAGPLESTKDVVFGGHCLAFENGLQLAESERFELQAHNLMVTVDTARLRHDRAQNTSFAQAPRHAPYRVQTCPSPVTALPRLERSFPKHPFVPDDEHEFDARAAEILAIQSTGLARRMLSASSQRLVIGLSGGLDSTLAFLVCLDALDKLRLKPDNLHAITMPGPGTTGRTLRNATRLSAAAGVSLTEIPIHDAVEQHLDALQHGGEHDVVFENAQARERTQILFDHANQCGGLVVGTGDLSELALGWCTFNADHMASYNVNASVPKTMMRYLVRWYASHRSTTELAAVLRDVLETPITPELIPPQDGEISQHTEAIIGPYELHDFFLYHFLRSGASPARLFHLGCISFAGDYSADEIKHWLRQFLTRFFTQQFKRTTLPPGPKVGTVSLSPRGDWRMPDEASVEQLLADLDRLQSAPPTESRSAP